MFNLKKILIRFSCLLFLLAATGCKKFITVDAPKDRLVSGSVFASDGAATAAIAGIYSSMMNQTFGFASAGMSLYPGLYADEFNNYSSNNTQREFFVNSLNPANSTVTDLWTSSYNTIYAANSIVEGLKNSTTVSPGVKTQLTGEAKFIRAFCHFYLLNLFGDIPLVTTTDYRENTIKARSSSAVVYQQIIDDLKDALNLLATDYAFSANERVRPNKWAAAALLARVYLYTGDYENAELQSTAIINNTSLFNLVNDLNSVFLKNSTEAIWQLMPVRANQNTNEGRYFILTGSPTSSAPGIAISNSLLNGFEIGDKRKINWMNSITVGSNTYYYPYKYKVKTSTGTGLTEYYIVFRLAEQLLIRAEARIQRNNLPGALADINSIRSRAGLPNSTANDKPAVILQIEKERSSELFAEWGHRWFDLKRTARADAILSPLKSPNWQLSDLLFPIPKIQVDNDPNTVQNPGY